VKRILLAAVIAQAAGPGLAQPADAAYCAQLGAVATRYLGKQVAGDTTPDTEIKMGLDLCQRGDTAAGIAMLEGKLRRGGITPPRREP
jgi:hypothetical protein